MAKRKRQDRMSVTGTNILPKACILEKIHALCITAGERPALSCVASQQAEDLHSAASHHNRR